MRVEVVRATLGDLEVALELRALNSVLTQREAAGVDLVDPAPWLGVEGHARQHVGLVLPEGAPPVGICLGVVRGFERWGARQLYPLPPWLGALTPDVLAPACGWDEEHGAIWVLDVAALVARRDAARG